MRPSQVKSLAQLVSVTLGVWQCFLSCFLLSTSEHKHESQSPGALGYLPEVSSRASRTSHAQVHGIFSWIMSTHYLCLLSDSIALWHCFIRKKRKTKACMPPCGGYCTPRSPPPLAGSFYTCNELHCSPRLPVSSIAVPASWWALKLLFPCCEAEHEELHETVSLLPRTGPARAKDKPRVFARPGRALVWAQVSLDGTLGS